MDLLWLAFRREGGGGGGRHVETTKWTSSGLHLNVREVVVGRTRRNDENNHLRLAFGCEGGGGSGSRVETTKTTTSGLRLDTRKVVVVAEALEGRKKPPPARV
jgi:hypothetical protein